MIRRRSLVAPLALLSFASVAHVEPTTWLSVGGGAGTEHHALDGRRGAGVFTWAIGVGTDPNGKFSVGGLFRTTTYFGMGTEIALGPRLATSGFTRGDFGLAFDLGVALRPFGRSDYGRLPIAAAATLGMPWGFEAQLGARLFDVSGQPAAQGLFVTFGIDLLRFSVHRRGRTEKAWPNPSAAGAPLPPVKALPGEEDEDLVTAQPIDPKHPPPPEPPPRSNAADDDEPLELK